MMSTMAMMVNDVASQNLKANWMDTSRIIRTRSARERTNAKTPLKNLTVDATIRPY